MTKDMRAGLWIDGREVPAQSGEYFPVIDPGRGEAMGDAARGMKEDVDKAVESAQMAFESSAWHALDPYQRGHLLWNWARKIEAEKVSIAELLSQENGKPLSQAHDEVGTTIRNFEYFAGGLISFEGGLFLLNPLSVVGHIIPWYYPLDLNASRYSSVPLC